MWFTSWLSQGAQCFTSCLLLSSLVYVSHSLWPLSLPCHLHYQHTLICTALHLPSLPTHPILTSLLSLLNDWQPASVPTDSPREWHQPWWFAGLPGVLPVPVGAWEEALGHVPQCGPQQWWCGHTTVVYIFRYIKYKLYTEIQCCLHINIKYHLYINIRYHLYSDINYIIFYIFFFKKNAEYCLQTGAVCSFL